MEHSRVFGKSLLIPNFYLSEGYCMLDVITPQPYYRVDAVVRCPRGRLKALGTHSCEFHQGSARADGTLGLSAALTPRYRDLLCLMLSRLSLSFGEV